MSEALQSLLGPSCPRLSASTVTRLKGIWEQEYDQWAKRTLAGKEYVYIWADGVHKTANILDRLPKAKHPKAKAMIHDIWVVDTREQSDRGFDAFIETYQAKYPKATECLARDRQTLLTFYDYPAEHWQHIRTTNPIESTFASIRLRHRKTKGSGSRIASLTMMFKLAESASKRGLLLHGRQILPDVLQGIQFKDEIRVTRATA